MSLKEPLSPSKLANSAIDKDAIVRFDAKYGNLPLGPICVVVPAFQEEETIGNVLDAIPDKIADLPVQRLVIIDGCTDRTESEAAQHGGLICSCRVNRGQGAALRLGYRLALERGAKFIVTVDADGQWDPTEMERLLVPLMEGNADFVQGSRRLGSAANDDRVRALGVRVFSLLVNLLTGAKITDSSSGFRAMRSAVVADLTLQQDQYQSSELLIATLARGFRVAERPVTMSARIAGKSKKGGNLSYGARYASVIIHTWWRERRRTR